MTDEEMFKNAWPEISRHGINHGWLGVAWDAWNKSRMQTIEDCIKAIESERLADPTNEADDIAYGNAINDCVRAVERLKNA